VKWDTNKIRILLLLKIFNFWYFPKNIFFKLAFSLNLRWLFINFLKVLKKIEPNIILNKLKNHVKGKLLWRRQIYKYEKGRLFSIKKWWWWNLTLRSICERNITCW